MSGINGPSPWPGAVGRSGLYATSMNRLEPLLAFAGTPWLNREQKMSLLSSLPWPASHQWGCLGSEQTTGSPSSRRHLNHNLAAPRLVVACGRIPLSLVMHAILKAFAPSAPDALALLAGSSPGKILSRHKAEPGYLPVDAAAVGVVPVASCTSLIPPGRVSARATRTRWYP